MIHSYPINQEKSGTRSVPQSKLGNTNITIKLYIRIRVCYPGFQQHILLNFRNGAANHRANDVVVTEGSPQALCGRFSYGPLDMAALTGEKVDIHIMKEPPVGDWVHVATEVTDKHGRLSHTLSREHTMGY